MSISWQILIKKHSYLDHRNPVELAFISRHWTPGSILGGGARGQNLVNLQKIVFLELIRKHSYLNHRYPVWSMPGGGGG